MIPINEERILRPMEELKIPLFFQYEFPLFGKEGLGEIGHGKGESQ
jgi:hypothetical protein